MKQNHPLMIRLDCEFTFNDFDDCALSKAHNASWFLKVAYNVKANVKMHRDYYDEIRRA